MKTLDTTFTGTLSLDTLAVRNHIPLPLAAVCDSDVELPSIPTTACLTVSMGLLKCRKIDGGNFE